MINPEQAERLRILRNSLMPLYSELYNNNKEDKVVDHFANAINSLDHILRKHVDKPEKVMLT